MPPSSDNPDFRSAWSAVRAELERSLPAATFDLWIEPLRAIGSQSETMYLTGPARVRTWVERRYLAPLEESLARLAPGLQRISLVEPPTTPSAGAESKRIAEPVPMDPTHDFERFVIGPQNRFAHAAALAVAEAPGEAYNPLFLHGPPGLGKTHLMGAIAGYLATQHPELTVHYTTAERFTSEFVTALRTQGPERFKQRYRGLDALLIDDIQFLEGKERTEEEFVHTFNTLFAAGKQIVMSSDRPPTALAALEERLRDRFAWGLTVEIEAPDIRTRIALLWRFASDAIDQLPEPEVLREIANRAPGNVRRLEGALTRVLAVSSVFGEPLASGAVDHALPTHASAVPPAGSLVAPSVAAIQEAVASVAGISHADLISAKRTPVIARARHLAMFLTRDLTPLSLVQIAREFNRDHSTVIHAIRAVDQRNDPGSDTAGDINTVRTMLGERRAPEGPEGSGPNNPESRPQL
ncbi:MAG: chromosomal replication initiator protein DnaA [Actinomycetota bacterium]|nr:chromosomal replication initiator protein DnaA [Actinomycetota bacterium]